MNELKQISITNKGRNAMLEYEVKSLRRVIVALGLVATCLVVTVIFLVAR